MPAFFVLSRPGALERNRYRNSWLHGKTLARAFRLSFVEWAANFQSWQPTAPSARMFWLQKLRRKLALLALSWPKPSEACKRRLICYSENGNMPIGGRNLLTGKA